MASTQAPIQSLSEVGLQFLETYFRETDFALTRHHIDSYEHCVFNEIPSIIHAANPIVLLKGPLDKDAGIFAYRIEVFIGGDAATSADLGITIANPVIVLDNGNTVRRMFPNEARLRNLTYAAEVKADILVRVTFTTPKEGGGYDTEIEEAPLIKGFPLFRLPILLRSRLCATSVSDPVKREEMGECRNDYGGYFIVSGAEKVLITRGEQAFNSLYVEKKGGEKDPVQAYASVVSLHPETKQTRRVALYLQRGGEIRVALPMIRGAFPLFILFRALGLESDEEIVRLIFPDAKDTLQEDLVPSIEDSYPIYNKYTAIKYIMSLTKGFTEAHVLDILQNLMLPHVPDEPMTKALYLADMARSVIKANAGLVVKTDRDDMRNQRFLSTGVLLRELFNGNWKDWRKAVTETIDRTYRANETMYEGRSVFELFASGNLATVFQPALLNKGIMRGFRGKWGTDAQNEKKGVLQPLARISYLDAMSHVRRVVSDFDTGSKITGPRKLHTSQIGYFCTSETPTGAHIGATKNMSMMTQYSFGAPTQAIYDWLKTKGGLIPVAETTATLRAAANIATVQINGGTVGFTMNPRGLVRVLKLFKWNAFLPPTASVSFNSTDRTVRLLLDEGRPIRPLWHLDGRGAAFLELIPTLKAMTWRALLLGTHPGSSTTTLKTTRFLDPLGELLDATFEEYETALAPTASFIEYCDPVEMNEAFISWWGSAEELTAEHTHAEIHPSTLTGLLASMIPYSNHNQAPRNQLSCSQSKQGIGTMVTNIDSRYDTYSHQLCYGEAPVCRTFMYETIGNGEMPYGFNCMIAATSESGYNQDDGLILNRDSIARGMFQSMSFRSYSCAEEVDPRSKVHSHVANPASVPSWTSLRPGRDYSKLDERGIIREGEIIDDTTVLVGRYMVIPDTNEIKDASITPGLHTQGRVDSVVVLHQGSDDGTGQPRLLVKVRIIEMREPQIGDKFSSRHGQKGTIGMFVSAADLPRTADGLVPDVMVNPGGLISRMTVAQLVEMVAGLVGVTVGSKMNATTFCNGGDFVTQLAEVLQAAGAQRNGDNVMYSGITGAQIRTDIFMCPLYFMRLKHLTDDKLNARGEGRREIRTHQPTGGRANEGGLRIGEMERDSLCAHAVSLFLQESMMKRGDGTTFWVCNGCGRIPIYNEAEKLFVCPTCDGPLEFSGLTSETLTLQLPTKQSRVTFSKVAIPFTLKLLDQELTTYMNTGLRFVTESSVSRMRESTWKWPSVDVEFKEGEQGVGEGVPVNPEEAAAAAAAATEAKKPKRKKGKESAVSAAAAPEGEESQEGQESQEGEGNRVKAKSAAELLAAAETAATSGVEPVQFGEKIENEYSGFNNTAISPFRITNKQIPAPDGKQYPDFGILAMSGSLASANRQTWPSVEHYFQAAKFAEVPEFQDQFMKLETGAEARKVGNEPSYPARGDWVTVKDRVMKAAVTAKFRQNLPLLSVLQATGDREIQYVSTDSYWGIGKNKKGENKLGRLLMTVREELKGVRTDLEALGSASGSNSASASASASGSASGYGEEEEENATQNQISDAKDQVAAATGGILQLGGGSASAVPGGGGVYLFINPAMGGSVESKARRARDRGRSRNLSWEGMSVSKEGGEGSDENFVSSDFQGGGSEEQMTTETGNSTEVTVQKLDS